MNSLSIDGLCTLHDEIIAIEPMANDYRTCHANELKIVIFAP